MVSIAFKKITLPNGLDLILHEDHSVPIAAVNVWYHVGSKDEKPGRTGFAHLFEHIMFEGSRHHNKSFFEPLQKVGGVLNGSTTRDRTNYWENIPSDHLETALWLESDRMGFLLDALDQRRFDVQRDVVKNERRQSYENRPYGMAFYHLQREVFPLPHPYNWWTIGAMEDLDAASLDDVKAFFKQFYGPNNASLAIAGDINPDQALKLVEKYFGDIPPIPPVVRPHRQDSTLQGAVSLSMEDKVQLPRLYLCWPSVHHFHPDEPALHLLSTILTDGKRSRLYRTLEYERQMVQEVGSFNYGGEIAGQFHVVATPAPGHTLDEVREALEHELARIRKEPPSREELERAVNTVETRDIMQLEQLGGFGGRADQLNHYNVVAGDPAKLMEDMAAYRKVNPEDIQRIAAAVMGERRVELVVLPQRQLTIATTGVDRTRQPESAGRPPFSPPAPQRRTLSNGMGLLALPKRGLPVVSMAVVLPAGGALDPADMPGLAYMTTGLLDEGTATRSSQQLAAELEHLGTRLSTRAERELSEVSSHALTATWARVLELVGDVTQRPSFPEAEVTRIKKQHLTDLARMKDDPTSIADRLFPGLLFGPASPYGHPMSGTERSVAIMERRHLAGYYEAYTDPRRSTLLVVGDVSANEALERAEPVFGGWRALAAAPQSNGGERLPDPSAHATTLYLVDKPGAAQTVIRAGHVGVPRRHQDYEALTLMNYVFGGHFGARLNANLRQDKGYSYGYRSFIAWMRDTGYLAAGGAVQTAVTKEAVEETLKEFRDIRGRRAVSAPELEDAKAGLLRSIPQTFETTEHLLDRLMQIVQYGLPDDYFASFTQRFEAVRLEDVHRVTQERLLPDHLAVLLVGDRAVIEPRVRELGLPITHLDSEGNPL